jgi:N-acetyl-anhydromuramyl-L-alanine amidase AmpD
MRGSLAILVALCSSAQARAAPPTIVERPIRYDAERIALTLEYIRRHYGIEARDQRITPRAIVIHWTGTASLEATWRGFDRVRMRASRRHLIRGGHLNVSAHFLVGRDGAIYRMVRETWMARHCIGLNFDAIGIENVGGLPDHPLTERQLAANEALVRELVRRHGTIRYLLGHHEWKRFESSPIFRERDATYRNAKADPGPLFMRRLRARLAGLALAASAGPSVRAQPAGSRPHR